MEKIRFTLDGRPAEAEAGETILKAARRQGVEIPTLCDDPRLTPYAGCRLCLVEIEKARGPLPSCATQVTEGMVVRTNSDTIGKLRRVCLDLLLSDHYGDCVAPCKLACPAGIDIQGFIALIAHGEYSDALKLIKETNPLPAVCGRVCPRFCEQKCRRNIVDEPLAINALKRFVADYDLKEGPYTPEVKPASGRRVAVVGGGPAGLSAAFYLAKEGHAVTIYDANPQLGGMLRYGIPEYRLPKELLDKEIATITSMCAEVRCGASLGRDFTVDGLKKAGFDAVFLALGAQASSKMDVEGEDLPCVLHGIGFLHDVVAGKKIEIGEKVAIVGGGNTAMDAARTALRLGAGEVTVVYRRSREEMPANHEEVEQAEEEGIRFHFLAAPVKITANGGGAAMECIKMALGEPDASGRRRPVPLEGSEFTMPVDTVIAAIGQTIEASGLDGGVQLDRRGRVRVKPEIMETDVKGVFAGGDCETGPDTVVRAVAAGRKAAVAIDMFLTSGAAVPQVKPYNCSKGELDELDPAEFADEKRIPRNAIPALPPEKRKDNFLEIEKGFDEATAKAEAMRCLSCGCQEVFDCRLRQLATEYGVDDKRFAGEKHRHKVHTDHPIFTRDPSKCILCGSCLRICQEVQGTGALSFVKRGFNTVIQPSFGLPLQKTLCDSCGQCVSACPTGALYRRGPQPKPGPWELEKVASVCPSCGIGCNIELGVKSGKVVAGWSPVGSPVNEGNLCYKGAFEYDAFYGPARVREPRIRRDGRLEPTTWEEAIRAAAGGLKKASDLSGGERVAVLASPKLTNEESYLAQKLARAALGTNNVASSFPQPVNNALQRCFGKNASVASFADVAAADMVLCFGFDVAAKYPVMALKIRKAVNNGTRLVIADRRPTRLDPLAIFTIKISPRISVEFLKTVINYILRYQCYDTEYVDMRTSGMDILERNVEDYSLEKTADILRTSTNRIIDFIHLYVRAKNPVILVDGDTVTSTELAWLSNLALISGNVGREGAGIITLYGNANRQGQIDMGVSPDTLPGHRLVDAPAIVKKFGAAWGRPVPAMQGGGTAEIIEGARSGELEGLLILSGGDDIASETIFGNGTFTVVVTPTLTPVLSKADVVLPGATFAETDGTVTNCERRVQRLHKAIEPLGGKETWRLLCELSSAIGYPMEYESAGEVFAEIAAVSEVYQGVDYDGIPAEGVFWLAEGEKTCSRLYSECFGFADGLARLATSNVLYVSFGK